MNTVRLRSYYCTLILSLIFVSRGDAQTRTSPRDSFSFGRGCPDLDSRPRPFPTGDTVRARRSIRHGYHGDKYKVVIGYIETDTVTAQELLDNDALGLRVLPDSTAVVIDSFSIGILPKGADYIPIEKVRGNRLSNAKRRECYWGNMTLYVENISAHRVSDGKLLRLAPVILWVR